MGANTAAGVGNFVTAWHGRVARAGPVAPICRAHLMARLFQADPAVRPYQADLVGRLFRADRALQAAPVFHRR